MARASFHLDEPEPKRRKVRKGTQSCWECRHRKVRCSFAATTDAICENCRRRGTACHSQEHPEELIPSARSNQVEVETRLGRVEELIEHLLDGAVTAHVPNSPTAKDLSEGHLTQLVRGFPRQPLARFCSDTAKARSSYRRTRTPKAFFEAAFACHFSCPEQASRKQV